MLRMAGAMITGGVCAYYGFAAADRLVRRRRFLNEMLTALSVLETEISFGHNELGLIFARLDKNKALCGFFGCCRSGMADKGIKRAWEDALEDVTDRVCLKNDDVSALLSLGTEIGMSDIRGQSRTIKRASELLRACCADADESSARLGRVYRSCGVLTGIFIVLALI